VSQGEQQNGRLLDPEERRSARRGEKWGLGVQKVVAQLRDAANKRKVFCWTLRMRVSGADNV